MIAMSLGWWELATVDPSAQDDTVARLLLAWFKGRMREEQQVHWLVFDSLDAGTLTEPALRLVREIAEAAYQQMAGELRVVLSAFDGPLHHEVEPYVAHDDSPSSTCSSSTISSTPWRGSPARRPPPLRRSTRSLSRASGCYGPGSPRRWSGCRS